MNEEQIHSPVDNKKTWMIVSLILFVIIAILIFFLIQGNKNSAALSQINSTTANQNQVTLGGTITFSGLVPSATDQATVKVFVRDADATSDEDFTSLGLTLPAQDNQSWSYNQALAGHNYEVMAVLLRDGLVLESSKTEEVTAPALHINLDFDVECDELGLDTSDATQQEISGIIRINGYVPNGASVQVTEETADGTQNWLTLAANAQEIPFTLSQINVQKNYTLYVNLLDKSGKSLGKSDGQTIANSGDHQVTFVIQSQAAAPATPTPTVQTTQNVASPAPAPTVKMSGQVLVNGPMSANSRMLILGKKPADADYKVWQAIDNPNNDGQFWQYDQAEIGQTYNVQVALQVNETNVGTARMITTVAPASNLNFTLNTGITLAAPVDQASPQPCQRDGNSWKTTIQIPWVSNAGQYWIQVGSKEGYADILNQKVAANGQNAITIDLSGFQLGVMNHVRYAYASCRSCGSSQNFSSWSQDKSFTCE